jgi:hypothetical protein
MKKTLIIIILATALLSTWFLTNLSFAYIPGLEINLASFRNDPYPAGNVTISIFYHHDSDDTMNIYLYSPTNVQVKTWNIDGHTGYLNYATTSAGGTWYLSCYILGEKVHEDRAFQFFDIPNTETDQMNLASDWARHPQYSSIFNMAWNIVGNANSSYQAAHMIQSHVLAHFPGAPLDGFRTDVDLLNDYNTVGHYCGICYSDAVILTAYARALGIPARIIKLTVTEQAIEPPPGHQPGGPVTSFHYFAEFKVFNGTAYEWIPVDGDQTYGWFGWVEANTDISHIWPANDSCTIASIYIVPQVSGQYQYTTATYPNPSLYHNDW